MSIRIFESSTARPIENIGRMRGLVLALVVSLHLVTTIWLLKPVPIQPKKSQIIEVVMLKPEPTKVEPVKEPPPAPIVKQKPIVKPPVPVRKITPPKPIAQPKILTTVAENAQFRIPKFEPTPVTDVAPNLPVAKSIAKPAETSGHGKDDTKSAGVDCTKHEPIYPPRLKSRHIEGWVKVEFVVTTEGEITNAVVVNSEPDDAFNDAALNAVNKFDCRAKIVNGAVVSQRASQTFQFKLTN